ncbi:hypothetical protein BJX96DRAFT_141026 [Aspergillus floccosus]
MQGDNDNDNVSLAQRLTTLEVKMIDLEFAIARMQSGRPEPPSSSPTPDRTPKNHNHHQQHQPRQSASGTSTPSEDTTDNRLSTSTIRPSTTPTPAPTHTYTSTYARPRMMHTPSMTSLNDGAGISVEQYSALVMLLRREQTARRTLEGEVSALREDVQALQRLAMGAGGSGDAGSMLGSMSMYPIRSAESSEFLRLRTTAGSGSGSGSAGRSTRSPYESSTSASDETEGSSAGTAGFRSRWQSSRRVEVGGMI